MEPNRSHLPPRDLGAAAVEFALLLPLLMMFLFGIIQYGYGLFQFQALAATTGTASTLASVGITDCATFSQQVIDLAESNGLNADDVTSVTLTWAAPDGSASTQAVPLGLARVSIIYAPVKIGVPFVPFPDLFHRTESALIQTVGARGIAGCPIPAAP